MDDDTFDQVVASVEAVIEATAPGSAVIGRSIGPVGHQIEVQPVVATGLPVQLGVDGTSWHVWIGQHLYDREQHVSRIVDSVIGVWLPRLITHGALESTWRHRGTRVRGRLTLLGPAPLDVVDISYAVLARWRSRRPGAVRDNTRFTPYQP